MTRIAAALLALLLLAAGCTADAGRQAAPAAGATGPSAGAAEGVLAFTASTVQGDPVDGEDYAGRDLMVWFWAPW